MHFYQIRFHVIDSSLDTDEDNFYGGIGQYDDNDELVRVICGCCGGTFEPNEVEVTDRYDEWMDLTETIVGN